MAQHRFGKRIVRGLVVLGLFGSGFICGVASQPPVEAQLGEMGKQVGKDALGQAAGSGGALGAAADLGTTIVDMETHVSALQKNLDALKKVKTALGG